MYEESRVNPSARRETWFSDRKLRSKDTLWINFDTRTLRESYSFTKDFKFLLALMSSRRSDEILHSDMSTDTVLRFLFMADRFTVIPAVCKALETLSKQALTIVSNILRT